MKEYIEREAALKAMSQAIQDRTWSMDDADVIEQMETNIEELPAADVVPVVHGEWKNHITYVECSVCGAMPYSRSMFCPNCGAHMDGGNNNGND